MPWPCSFHFYYVTNKIALCKFLQKLLPLIYFQFWAFLVRLGNWSEFLSCVFLEASYEMWRKINFLPRETGACQNLQGKNPTIVKLAVDNLNLPLCDSHDSDCAVLIAQTNCMSLLLRRKDVSVRWEGGCNTIWQLRDMGQLLETQLFFDSLVVCFKFSHFTCRVVPIFLGAEGLRVNHTGR